jgi:hypothetical protein
MIYYLHRLITHYKLYYYIHRCNINIFDEVHIPYFQEKHSTAIYKHRLNTVIFYTSISNDQQVRKKLHMAHNKRTENTQIFKT